MGDPAEDESTRSPGSNSAAGLSFQYDYLASKILSLLGRAELAGVAEPTARFQVESRTCSEGPFWDLIWKQAHLAEFLECKDALIQRNDRTTFYIRVRDTLNGFGQPLQIGWVLNPSKQTDNVCLRLREMCALARSGSWNPAEIRLPPVCRTADDFLHEAVYHLSHNNEPASPAISQGNAIALLANATPRFWQPERLSVVVERQLENLLPGVNSERLRNCIHGAINHQLARNGSFEDDVINFFQRLALGDFSLVLSTEFRTILSNYSGRRPLTVPTIKWRNIAGEPSTVWMLADRLPTYDGSTSCLLVAEAGCGKSTTTIQAFEHERSRRSADHVIRIEVGAIEIELAQKLPDLCSILCGGETTWVCIDGLDKMDNNELAKWRQILHSLNLLPNLILLLTARREVITSLGWFQDIGDRYAELNLERLTENQVARAIQDVGIGIQNVGAQMMDWLRNPFLLRIFADIQEYGDLSLGSQTSSFALIEKYWTRRVSASSEGARLVGPSSSCISSKLSAVKFLKEEILRGKTRFSKPHSNQEISNGLQMLSLEGVLHDVTSSMVKWSHDWLLEFALAEAIVESVVGSLTPNALVDEINRLSSSSLQRAGSVAVSKWLLLRPQNFTIEEFFATLYRRSTGLAREAITVMLEGPSSNFRVSHLPAILVAEIIQLATEMKLLQWGVQFEEIPDALLQGATGNEILRALSEFEKIRQV